MKFFIILLLLSSNVLLYGQKISGTVLEMNSDKPVEYVNIGVVGRNIGTVSDQNGKYTLEIKPEHHDDTLRFSCIGYHSYSVKVSDFISLDNWNISLEEKLYDLAEVVVRPKKIKQKTLGNTVRVKFAVVCAQDSINGFELGALMQNKGRAFLKEVNFNISVCSYDTIFYRINIYKAHDVKDMQFENILTNPIYITSIKEDVKDKITIDFRHLNIVVDGDFLISIENVKNMGPGSLCYPISLLHKSYLRQASQGEWRTVPYGISLSVKVDVEK